MIEHGLGVNILLELILKRISYHITARELALPAYRNIRFIIRDKKTTSLTVKNVWNF